VVEKPSDTELLDFVLEHFDLTWDEFDSELMGEDGGVICALDREDLVKLLNHVRSKEARQ